MLYTRFDNNSHLPHIIGDFEESYWCTGGARKPEVLMGLKLYSDDDQILLAHELKTLASQIEEILRSGKNDSKLIADSKRILLQTYKTILNPTREMCDQLSRMSNEVSGSGSDLVKVGIVLGTIIGLLLGVIPGLFFAAYHFENDTWNKSNTKGLALLPTQMVNIIQKIEPLTRGCRESYFFKPASKIANTSDQPPAYDGRISNS